MTDAEAKQLADELADKIDDIIYARTSGDGGSGVAAAEIVAKLPQLLYQAGWMPPETRDRVHDWIMRTVGVPEHHINRDVWNSHLAELTDIMHGH